MQEQALTAHAAHIPVLCHEVVAALRPRDGGVYVDATFGAGGYSAYMLASAKCTVYAIDRDPEAKQRAQQMIAANVHPHSKLVFLEGCFSGMQDLLQVHGVRKVDGVMFDFGVSSMQLDEAERGFSFRYDAPLDMRMSQQGRSAADIIANADEDALADIFFHYGEERAARTIARAIVQARAEQPIVTTTQLADIVRASVRRWYKGKISSQIDLATRSFQGLRIAVNDELDEIKQGLVAATALLCDGGRLAAVSFHSLEDRLVKQHIVAMSGRAESFSRHVPHPESVQKAELRAIGKAVSPSTAEVERNPRARSARLRVAEKLVSGCVPVFMGEGGV